MKFLSFAFFLFLVIPEFSDCQANTPATSTWSLIWLPFNDTFSSWNWEKDHIQMIITKAGLGYMPDEIKTWELAVCSTSDPGKKAEVPLLNPHSAKWDGLEDWTPGAFPVDKLEALGEGTFLCAILGDGHRFSNVSRVTINHSYLPNAHPEIRIFVPPSEENNIKTIGLWVVPAPQQSIWNFDIYFPYVCVDGTWSAPMLITWSGQVRLIPPGTGYGTFIELNNYLPPIKPFKKAQVQIKIIRNADKQFESGPPIPFGANLSQLMKDREEHLQGYTSEAVTLSAPENNSKLFDQAFGLK